MSETEALVHKIRSIGDQYGRFSHSFEDLRFIQANATEQVAMALYVDLDKEFTTKGEDRCFVCTKTTMDPSHPDDEDLFYLSVPTKAGESLLRTITNVLGYRSILIKTKGIGHHRDSSIQIAHFDESNIWVHFGKWLELSPFGLNSPEEKFIIRKTADDAALSIPRAVWQGAIRKVAVLASLISYWREGPPTPKVRHRSAKRFRVMAEGSVGSA